MKVRIKSYFIGDRKIYPNSMSMKQAEEIVNDLINKKILYVRALEDGFEFYSSKTGFKFKALGENKYDFKKICAIALNHGF